MVTYVINHAISDSFETWLVSQPNYISNSFIKGDHETIIEFNHNAAQETAFKELLNDRMNLNNDNAMKYSKLLLSDTLLYVSEFTITKTNVNIAYVNLFTDFAGRPFLADTSGYSKIAVQILWNKNAGVSAHDLRIVNDAVPTEIFYEKLNLTNGENVDSNFTIPAQFINFKGKLRIQVKAGNATDDPIFSSIRIYLRR